MLQKTVKRNIVRHPAKLSNISDSINQTIVQRKTFCRKRIPEASYAGTETLNVDILITSRNGDRKIRQTIRIMSGLAMIMRR